MLIYFMSRGLQFKEVLLVHRYVHLYLAFKLFSHQSYAVVCYLRSKSCSSQKFGAGSERSSLKSITSSSRLRLELKVWFGLQMINSWKAFVGSNIQRRQSKLVKSLCRFPFSGSLQKKEKKILFILCCLTQGSLSKWASSHACIFSDVVTASCQAPVLSL